MLVAGRRVLVLDARMVLSSFVRSCRQAVAFILYHSIIFVRVWTGGRVGMPRYGKCSPGVKERAGIWAFCFLIWSRRLFIQVDFSLRNFSIRLSERFRGARIMSPFSGWIWTQRVRRFVLRRVAFIVLAVYPYARRFSKKSLAFSRQMFVCRGGGIGRHAAFRSLCPQGCESSNLSRGTRWVRNSNRIDSSPEFTKKSGCSAVG